MSDPQENLPYEDKSPRTSSPSPRLTRSPRRGGSVSQPFSGRHSTYRGVRARSGKWVSEIREPRKTKRIWLGTYPTPDMAAAAYDVAALALKGQDTILNFPESRLSYQVPVSNSASDIRAAAAQAAEARQPTQAVEEMQQRVEDGDRAGTSTTEAQAAKFVDEDELLNMPSLLVDMAEAMMVSPPRIKSDDSPGEQEDDGYSLWTYP